MKYAALWVTLALSACGGSSEDSVVPETRMSTTPVTVVQPAPAHIVVDETPIHPHPVRN